MLSFLYFFVCFFVVTLEENASAKQWTLLFVQCSERARARDCQRGKQTQMAFFTFYLMPRWQSRFLSLSLYCASRLLYIRVYNLHLVLVSCEFSVAKSISHIPSEIDYLLLPFRRDRIEVGMEYVNSEMSIWGVHFVNLFCSFFYLERHTRSVCTRKCIVDVRENIQTYECASCLLRHRRRRHRLQYGGRICAVVRAWYGVLCACLRCDASNRDLVLISSSLNVSWTNRDPMRSMHCIYAVPLILHSTPLLLLPATEQLEQRLSRAI